MKILLKSVCFFENLCNTIYKERRRSMKKLSLNLKKIASLFIIAALIITSVFVLSACGDDNNENNNTTASNLYDINFGGNIDGEKYDVEATTWQESEEEGFEAVYTLVGEVPYNKDVADQMGYTDGRVNFALIRFTSSTVNKVNYDKATQEGFYAEITNFYGTDHQAEPTIKHGGFSSGNETTSQTTYFLYQGVDNTVRTMTVKISFDGTEENARLYKFVIDPANYTLEERPIYYNIDFNGNIDGEKYNVAGTSWEQSAEEGFEAVYTLVGEVPYNKGVADQMGYTDGRVNFALIRFTSNLVDKVNYDETTQEGFYAEITNFYGTDHQAEPTIKHGGFSSGNETTSQTTYFLYQGVDDTVRTMTIKISFDGTEENARLYKFVIDPANYTLESAPAVQVVDTPVSIGSTEFENADGLIIAEVEPNRFMATGNVATMTAEQAEAFWAGVAQEGDKYVILNLTFEANSTIKYGFVDHADTTLTDSAKSFEANEMTSEDFILRVNAESSNMIWRVEITTADDNTIVYTVDMSNLTFSL